MSAPASSPPQVHITTLGCSKNQVDSDKISALLSQAGYRPASSADTADVVMVNTCAFIEAARQESVETILEMSEAKRANARLLVIGCMAQRFGREITQALEEVDAVVGLDRYGDLVGLLDEMTGWTPVQIGPRRTSMDILDLVDRPAPTLPYAYVKAAEGCNKTCAFCAIPLMRGRQRSRNPFSIREEILSLVQAGVSEVVLVAQDLAAYGRDSGLQDAPAGSDHNIVDLLRLVAEVDALQRIRLLYLYPTEIRPPLIEEMVSNPVVAPYFDLSLQHASRSLLRTMRRPGGTDRHLDLIGRIRKADPEAALRSSFIVGYPGETEQDVQELAEFLTAAQLDWAGFFPFSPEPGTDAVQLSGRIDRDEIGGRIRELAGIQEQITAVRNAEQIGQVSQVLIDQVEEGVPVGRSYRQAPEIDGLICLDRGQPGEWVQAEITGSYETDLVARVLHPSQPELEVGR